MKRMVLIAVGMLLIGSVAVAAEFATSGLTGTVTHEAGRYCAGDWITQNFDPGTVGTSQVACANQGLGFTTENWWGRIFLLEEDHYLFCDVVISQIEFAVEMVTASFGIEIVVYDFPGVWPMPSAAVLATLEQYRYPVTIDPSMDMSIVTIDTDACIPEGSGLIVAIDAVTGEMGGPGGSNVMFWSGANAFGATMDSYLASASCNLPDPTPVSAIGFPDAQTILNLCVDCGDCGTTPINESSWGAVKSLYR